MNNEAGKGSAIRRGTNWDNWDKNYDAIFKRKLKKWMKAKPLVDIDEDEDLLTSVRMDNP